MFWEEPFGEGSHDPLRFQPRVVPRLVLLQPADAVAVAVVLQQGRPPAQTHTDQQHREYFTPLRTSRTSWGAETAPRHCPAFNCIKLPQTSKHSSPIAAVHSWLFKSSPETFGGSHSRTAIPKHPKCFSFIIKRLYHKEVSRGSQPGTEQKGNSLSCALPTTSGSSLKGCTKHSSLPCPCWWQQLREENTILESNCDS